MWFITQKLIVSPYWSPKVQTRAVGRGNLLLTPVGENSSALTVSSSPRCSLVWNNQLASNFCLHPLPITLFPMLLLRLLSGLQSYGIIKVHRTPERPHLIKLNLKRFYFWIRSYSEILMVRTSMYPFGGQNSTQNNYLPKAKMYTSVTWKIKSIGYYFT